MSSLDFAQRLLAWYADHKRDLPWRGIKDAYRIWVSEIILQQTRIVQGYAYYLRFIAAFPTVKALAEATEDEVLHSWQGLGYYSRARNMRAAAQQIMTEMNGEFPTTYEAIRKLKGVGDYTAAAISSFAYDLPHAVVDGNVYRVLSRYFGIATAIDSTEGKKYFRELAQQLLPTTHQADYNQALMDFGATQCTPSSPQCQDCVLRDACEALHTDRISELPIKQHKVKVRQRYFIYIKVLTPRGIWLHRRTDEDIWKGLYEYPLLEFDAQPTETDMLQTTFLKSLPMGGVLKQQCANYRHVLTHQVIHASLYTLTFDTEVAPPTSIISVPQTDIDAYAMPQILRKMEKV